nr:hypothetical protein [Tanacetum cinerariifolium]
MTKVLQCQLPPKELNPRNFTLPCTIGNFDFYDMADLGASVNVMPRNIFEYLRLANLRNTNMLVEMAVMTKKAPLCIIENILAFLTTIHAEINVFDKEIYLGIDNDRVSYDMEKDPNFTTPTEKIFMIKSDLDNRPQSPACSNTQSRNLSDRSLDNSLHDQGRKKGHILDKIWEYCKDVHSHSTYWWHDHGFEDKERDEMGIKIEKYDPPHVLVETFEVKKYSFKSVQSFVCVTKEVNDALPLRRKNGSRFREMIRKEFDVDAHDKT